MAQTFTAKPAECQLFGSKTNVGSWPKAGDGRCGVDRPHPLRSRRSFRNRAPPPGQPRRSLGQRHRAVDAYGAARQHRAAALRRGEVQSQLDDAACVVRNQFVDDELALHACRLHLSTHQVQGWHGSGSCTPPAAVDIGVVARCQCLAISAAQFEAPPLPLRGSRPP